MTSCSYSSQNISEKREMRNTCSLCYQKLSGANWIRISSIEGFCENCYNAAKKNKNYEITLSHFSKVIAKSLKDKYCDNDELLQYILCLVIANEELPYWLQCTNSQCLKWHEVRTTEENITSGYIETFHCESIEKVKTRRKPSVVNIKNPEWKKWYNNDTKLIIRETGEKFQCRSLEKHEVDERVEHAKSSDWVKSVSYPPILKYSRVARCIEGFSPEEVGFYPTQCNKYCKCPNWIEPFTSELYLPPIWVKPDTMDDLEYEQFCTALEWKDILDSNELSAVLQKETKRLLFLGLRNILITLWNLSPCQWLTATKVNMHIICRGMTRINLLSHIDNIIWLLTKKGIINYGFLSPPKSVLSVNNDVPPVVIIGAGIAGLAAARQLNKVGIKTIILEARERIGGRISEDKKICYGSQFINGLINNPLTILCHQAQFQIEKVNSDPVFISENSAVPPESVERMIMQFGGIMEYALKKAAKQNSRDSNWLDVMTKDQEDYKKVAEYSVEENKIFDFMPQCFDIENRSYCSQLTLKYYEYPKKLGEDGYIVQGLSSFLNKLAEGLDIQFLAKVHTVNYRNSEIEVITGGDSRMPYIIKAKKVIVTVPIPVLRDQIQFDPPLPRSKYDAIEHLGNVIQEKVIIHFPKRFWIPILHSDTLKLGIVSCDEQLPFQYFIDVSNLLPVYQPTLVTFITNHNKHLLHKTDEDIVELCLTALKKVFNKLKIDVPSPVSSFVTHWTSDPLCGTAGSFVKVGFKYDIYDAIAEPVNSKIFFAGDATFRSFPNSMTGAFLSGLREAANVIQAVENVT